MQIGKRLLSVLLSAVLLAVLGAPALAADPEPPAAEEEPLTLMDPEELTAMVTGFMAERGLDDSRFSMAFCYTGTGETFYYNADTYINGASLYKLSLMMGLARKVAAGELQQTDQLYGMDISYIEMRSLTYSDNEVSEAIIGYFSPFRAYRLMQAEIAGIPEAELPEEYFTSNSFSARFMLGVLQELYAHPEKYPNVIECLRSANPGEYFRLTLDGQYDVAQKYGGGDGYLHTAGIIYTPTPCLLVVMTHNASNAEYAIANMAQLMADYAVTMDRRRDKLREAQAEAERAAREAEQARLDAEQAEQERLAAERSEQERQRLEEEAALAAAEAETPAATAPLPSEAPAETVDRPEDAAPLRLVVIALAAGAAALLAVYLVRSFTRRKVYR